MINWLKIDTVLLDMDGTILDLSFDNYFWLEFLPSHYAKINDLELEQARTILFSKFNALRGDLKWYCLDYWSDELAIDIPELKKTIGDRVQFRADALAFLQFLKASHCHVHLVTNAHRKSLEIKMLNQQFHQYFDHLFSSHDFGFAKESQKFWKKFSAEVGLNAKRSLFIDDSLSVLHSAKEFGIVHVYGIKTPDSTKPPIDLSPFPMIDQFAEIMA